MAPVASSPGVCCMCKVARHYCYHFENCQNAEVCRDCLRSTLEVRGQLRHPIGDTVMTDTIFDELKDREAYVCESRCSVNHVALYADERDAAVREATGLVRCLRWWQAKHKLLTRWPCPGCGRVGLGEPLRVLRVTLPDGTETLQGCIYCNQDDIVAETDRVLAPYTRWQT